MVNKAVTISKKLSYVLRHKEDVQLDSEGWLDINTALKEVQSQSNKLGDITVDDLKEVSETFDKKRFEIAGNKIRAKYGHSQAKIEYEPAKPPKHLYHGTPMDLMGKILKEGLQSMDRQYVHMSVDLETAQKVGKRHSRKVAVFTIDSEKAWETGQEFYKSDDGTWLTEEVSSEFLGEILYI